jgi:prophage regulatory protein
MANYALNEFGDLLFKEMIVQAAKTMGLIKNERQITVNNDEVIRLQKLQSDRIIAAINDVSTKKIDTKKEDTKNNDVMILLKKDVLERTRLSYPTIWRMEKKGEFPKRIKLSSSKIGYYKNEIEQWMLNRERFFSAPNAIVTGAREDAGSK